MVMLLLMAAVFSNAIQNICAKQYGQKQGTGVFTFNLMTVLMALAVFSVGCGELPLQGPVMLFALIFAITYAAAVIFITMALQCGPLSISSLIYSYTLIVPAIYGIAFLDEPLRLTTVLGLILLVLSLSFSREKASGEEAKKSVKWAVYITFAFAGNGICSTVLKVQQISLQGMYRNEFMVLSLLMVSVILLVCCVLFERKQILTSVRSGWHLGVIRGFANGLGNSLVLILNGMVAASVMYPAISAGGVVASALVAVLIYKEKLTKMQQIGIVLGIGSIVLLNL